MQITEKYAVNGYNFEIAITAKVPSGILALITIQKALIEII